ncbi:MAG: hypothetical protein LBN38_08100 [Verrucomicrobiota bacterium]|jgi:hypothetical protein|nr:hypothetical protein [Verrucomicrobiota bacterium]
MKRFVWMGTCLIVALGLSGCEWGTGSDSESWSSSYNWVNFSGAYRSAAGGILVTDYTSTPSTPGSTNIFNTSESGGTLPVNERAGGGKTQHTPIAPGSFSLRVGDAVSLSDNGNGILEGSGGNGKVSYTGGTWNFELYDWAEQFQSSQSIRISYAYYVSNAGTGGSGAQAGSSGKTIYSFMVTQQGQNITLTDNNGAVYSGYIKQMRSTTGAERDHATGQYMPQNGDMIVASFECKGTSAAGKEVRIVGTLQGEVAASVFTGRTMTGTWIETNGKTGDINGTTAAIAISPPVAAVGSETVEGAL